MFPFVEEDELEEWDEYGAVPHVGQFRQAEGARLNSTYSVCHGKKHHKLTEVEDRVKDSLAK